MKEITPSEKIIIYKEAYLHYFRNPHPFGNFIGIIYGMGDQRTGITGEDLENSTLVTVRPSQVDDEFVYALSPEAASMAALLHKSLTVDILRPKLISMCEQNVKRKEKQCLVK